MLGLPQTSKDQFIWMYRNHHPTITIDNDVLAILRYLKNTTRGVSILTDGRTITQRNKINALCLQEFTAYISEEFNNAENQIHSDLNLSNRFTVIVIIFMWG